jgi:hypothetical protein
MGVNQQSYRQEIGCHEYVSDRPHENIGDHETHRTPE